MVLLSQAVDPARILIDQQIASAGSRAFRAHDVAAVPELLDQVSIHGRAGLLRQSATRFQRAGVVYKPLEETITVGCALAWRAENRSPAVISLRDLLLFHAGQMN